MFIDRNGKKWYKGNLHTHTNVSDGRYAPADTLALYAENGYDFIALTEHYKYTDGRVDADSGLLVLPGCEYDTGASFAEGIYHVLSICAEREPSIDRTNGKPSVQEIVTAIKEAGGVAILAHPAWSLDEPCEVEKLVGLDACEIYNTVSGKPWNLRPYSGLFVDRLFSDGYDIGCVACDDAHFYNGDACVSFIYLQIDGELTADSVRQALLDRRYLATQGPFFHIEKTDEGIAVETESPDNTKIVDITFFTDAAYAAGRVITDENGLTRAVYKPATREHFVRVEVTDELGRTGWSGRIGC